jgi:6-phosphogluconolactonase
MLKSWDDRRNYIVAGNKDQTTQFCTEHWVHSAKRAIQQKGKFSVALSGGSTPKAIYQALIQQELDWSKVWLFWSDERNVSPEHAESNYRMAMEEFDQVPIPKAQIFRMKAENQIEKNAADYEDTLVRVLDKHLFDLVMLGVGQDGHTASLFPNTKGLSEEKRLVLANEIPQKQTWRITLTFPCIAQSSLAVIYAIGSSKADIVPKVLNAAIESPFPASRVGTHERKALWILDQDAAKNIDFSKAAH